MHRFEAKAAKVKNDEGEIQPGTEKSPILLRLRSQIERESLPMGVRHGLCKLAQMPVA